VVAADLERSESHEVLVRIAAGRRRVAARKALVQVEVGPVGVGDRVPGLPVIAVAVDVVLGGPVVELGELREGVVHQPVAQA